MFESFFFLDDDPDLRIAYQSFAEQNGYVAIVAASVSSMIEIANKVMDSKAAFLDLDLGRQQASGIDALNWLRRHDYNGQIYFLTGHGRGHHLVAESLAIGDVKVVAKPVSPSGLLQLMRGGPA